MSEALEVLVGPEAKGLSAGTVARLKHQWADEYQDWIHSSLEKHQWVDGIHSSLKAENTKLRALTVIGIDEKGPRPRIYCKH